MSNQEILKSILKPKDINNLDKWNEFLNYVDQKILWYPSAGNDFEDLSFMFSGLSKNDICPSAFIHTDYFADEELFRFITENGPFIYVNPFNSKISEFNKRWSFELSPSFLKDLPDLNYNYLTYPEATTLASSTSTENVLEKLRNISAPTSKIKYLKPKKYEDFVITGKKSKLFNRIFLIKVFQIKPPSSKSKYLMYAFYNNVLFLNQFIIETGLTLSNIYSGKNLIN